MENISKRRAFVKQLMGYFAVALVGYGFDFATLVILHEVFSLHYLLATTVGFIIGLVVVYFLSNRYVFGESKLSSRKVEFIIFSTIGVIGLVILNALMFIFTDLLGIMYIASKIIATIFVYAWNFLARRMLYTN